MKRFFLIMLLSLFLISGCADKKDTVIIYSCMEDNRNQALQEQLKEKFKDIEVKVQPMATGNAAAKIKSEGKDVEADIIIDLETAHAANLQSNFADLSNYDSSMYLDGVNNSNKYFVAHLSFHYLELLLFFLAILLILPFCFFLV